ncbi:MAG: SPASM domain-containing protein [Magnetococcales bacterium]|nr:SPASM domain-containing protein [Magnetococcales bacterium]
MKTFKAPVQELHAISRWDNSGQDLLSVASLLVGVENDPDGPSDTCPDSNADVLPLISDISMDIAGSCNLSCRYCFEDDIDSRYGFPSEQTLSELRRMLRQVEGLARHVNLHFGSGEPLLNFIALRQMVDEVLDDSYQSGRTLSFNITTNATLVTPEIADFLANRPFIVRVSCDGPEAIHNANRPYRNGQASYRHVMRGLELLLDRLPDRLIVNSVVTTGTRIHDVWSWAVSQGVLHQNTIKVGARADSGMLPHKAEIEQYQRDFRSIAEAMLCILDEGRRPMDFQPLTKPVLRLSRQRRQERYCGAGGTYLGISVNGGIYPCFRFLGLESYKMGNVSGSLDETARTSFLTEIAPRVSLRNDCSLCWARYLCGGGCYADSVMFGEDRARPLAAHCSFTKIEIETAVSLYARLMERPTEQFLTLYGIDVSDIISRLNRGHGH